ncbi:phospholipase [Desulfomarina profundi]|uniref:Phospholipase n=1 Tax=Desulfomarina profundi TaxID=2772557 RepID=A0A8D5FJB0_9BACT|nr:phospholipase A [Desulfomarina profundi]BCL62428.1 phospholipase [Desulfomarina profundi]
MKAQLWDVPIYSQVSVVSLFFFFFCFSSGGIGQKCYAGDVEECMVRAMQTAEDSITIGELRLQCQKDLEEDKVARVGREKNLPLVERRIYQDRKHVLEPFTLMAHKPNYVLFASYNSSSYDATPFQEQYNNPDLECDDVEAKFQLSIKFPLLVNLGNDTFDIYAAYTNRSFWQVYNNTESAPFRETNHEPEIWVQFHPRWEFFGFTNVWNSFGINHQSNGRDGVLSRSWNRLFAWFTVERGNLAMSFKPWYRIPSDGKDENPGITDYMGHYELSASYKWQEHVFSVMSRNNLESGFHSGAVELSWSFPLWHWPFLRGYVQYFNGYGESLLDYNRYTNAIGIGFSLTDWL